ncbi:hypothetical protein MPLDJ20_110387 [Mesorhizobium plurifarium]|uniref:Methyltransferase domain-containing protein n=1 Tax=Mesorhizobium plurifarium TaxID=69974 RepID=A0A090E3S4_MESPL|nr:hypothetical protein MPLDJ20_110387 [Mesorhizobium plurifarium]
MNSYLTRFAGKLWRQINDRLSLKIASRAFARGKYAESIIRLRPILEADPTSKPVQNLLARSFAETGRFHELDNLIEGTAKISSSEKIQSIASVLSSADKLGWETQGALRLIQYSRQVRDKGADHDLPIPYQSMDLGTVSLPGLRDTSRRLNLLPIEFEGKTVLDIGCSLGGFLFSLSRTLRWGVGIDIDWRSINVCQKLKSVQAVSNLDFYVHDIETQPLSLIEQFLPDPTVDIVFIMRIMSGDSLSKVLEYAAGISRAIVFEPIYSHHAREIDLAKLRSLFSSVKVIETDIFEPLDGRQHTIYLATNPVTIHAGA